MYYANPILRPIWKQGPKLKITFIIVNLSPTHAIQKTNPRESHKIEGKGAESHLTGCLLASMVIPSSFPKPREKIRN